MASQAIHVFYVSDPANLQLSLVVPMKPRNFDHSPQVDDDINCNDIPPFIKGLPSIEEIDNVVNDDVSHLLRLDIEPVSVEKVKGKK